MTRWLAVHQMDLEWLVDAELMIEPDANAIVRRAGRNVDRRLG